MAGDVDHTAREKLMRALLGGAGPSAAARASGYSRKHVAELLRQPAFCREFERRRAAQPQAEADPDELLAVEALRRVVRDVDAPGAAVVAAARALREVVADRKKLQPDGAAPGQTAQEQAERAGQNAARILKGGKSA